MGTGNLIIQVQNASGSLPLGNASIKVTDTQNTVIYERITDESGQTGKLALPAIDRQYSLDAAYRGVPYTAYNVEVRAAGYNHLTITGVQIFDGETAIQPAVLIPMTRSQNVPEEYTIEIPGHLLTREVPQNQAGPLIEPFVLRHVIIPDPITVHLGTPASSAANVRPTFTDYVKNVASSEIYPTWPQTALEANIYAIITFALNRVFTEWYRSRGYSFDITNSTAYDQAFIYGRTIYDSVSRIVDRIFNQYVRRPGQTAPFFTSFCNGTTSTCAGLSQWGTVTLSNQGMSPLQILRYYYPDDIEISETNIITGVVVSYPGTALRTGSTGRDVEVIQHYLTRIRRNYPGIPEITDESGYFGSSTEAAVRKFQSVFGLGADGIVGPATWNKISSIYVAVARLAELNSEGTDLGIGTVPPATMLRYGSEGNDVITLQVILSVISEFYPTVPIPSLNGLFDTPTRTSVIAFQQLIGLAADGIVGPATWAALYETYWGIIDEESRPDPGGFEYTVRGGDSLWLLAQRFGTTVAMIKSANNLSGDTIYVGQVLFIPQ